MKVVLTKNGSDFRKEVSFDSKDFINFNTKTYHVNNADFANLKESQKHLEFNEAELIMQLLDSLEALPKNKYIDTIIQIIKEEYGYE